MKKNSATNLNYLIVFFALLALSAPWINLNISNHSFVKSVIADIGIGIFFLFSVWKNQQTSQLTVQFTPLKISLLLLFILGGVSILWSDNLGFFLTKYLIWLGGFFSFFVAQKIQTKEDVFKFCLGLSVFAFLVSLLGILQHLFGLDIISQAAKPASTFGNKNMATQGLILALPLMLYAFLSEKITQKHTIFIGLSIALTLVFVFYTTTRSSWLSLLVEGISISILLGIYGKKIIHWNIHKTRVSWAVGALLLILINFSGEGFTPFWEVFSQQIQRLETSVTNSESARYQIWRVAQNIIQDAPIFGHALGSWFQLESVNSAYATANVYSYQRIHNDILELGVELGLAGFLALFGVILFTLKNIFTLIKTSNNSGFYRFLLIALIGSFVNMQFSFPYQLAIPVLFFGFFMGFIARENLNPIKTYSLKLTQKYKTIFNVSALIVVVISSGIYLNWMNNFDRLNTWVKNGEIISVKQLKSTIFHQKIPINLRNLSSSYAEINDFRAVETLNKRLLKIWPDNFNAVYHYGNALLKLGKPQQALRVAKRGKTIAGKGVYRFHILEIEAYLKLKNWQAYQYAFLKLMQENEADLAIDNKNYIHLVRFSMVLKPLWKYTNTLYQTQLRHHGYECMVEYNMAQHYLHQNQLKPAVSHLKIILEHNDTCAPKSILKLVKDNP
jgi:O-antigen ligase